MANGTETKKSIVLTGELADLIQAMADREHRSFSNMVEFILQRHLDAQESVPGSPSMAGTSSVARKSKSA